MYDNVGYYHTSHLPYKDLDDHAPVIIINEQSLNNFSNTAANTDVIERESIPENFAQT